MAADKTAHPSQAQKSPSLIYVVDDDTMIGEVVEAILSLEGFDLQVFPNPQTALETFAQAENKPVLLLTDFLMTPINGMELIQHCKNLEPTLKTLLYSGYVQEEVTDQYPVKPDAFLRKPFQPRKLVQLVQRILKQSPKTG